MRAAQQTQRNRYCKETARNYQGSELKRGAVNALIVRRPKVVDEALRLARELAGKPRLALTAPKRELARRIERELPATI